MLFADYGESYAGPRQPGYANVNPLSHRQADGMLVYQRGHGLMAPKLPSQFVPVHVGTTEATRSPSATTPVGTVRTLSMKSTTLPQNYAQQITISAPKQLPGTLQVAPRPVMSAGGSGLQPQGGPTRTAPTVVPKPRPIKTPTVPSFDPSGGGTMPAPAPSGGGGGGGGGGVVVRPPARPDAITFPPDVGTKVAQVLTPAPKSNLMWWLVGGLGVAGIVGGAYYMTRRR